MENYFLKILFIEDNDFDAYFYQSSLSRSLSDRELNFEHVKTLSETEELYKKQKSFDVVLLDLNLPDSRGVETLSQVSNLVDDIPIIVLSGVKDKRTIDITKEMGAAAFFVKGLTDKNIATHIISVINRKNMSFAPGIEKLDSRN